MYVEHFCHLWPIFKLWYLINYWSDWPGRPEIDLYYVHILSSCDLFYLDTWNTSLLNYTDFNCSRKSCHNDGTCSVSDNSCTCPSGYGGDFCQSKLSLSSPDMYSNCIWLQTNSSNLFDRTISQHVKHSREFKVKIDVNSSTLPRKRIRR